MRACTLAILLPLIGFASILGAVAPARAAGTASLTLNWTAPGDDSLTGRASAYDLRFAFDPITPATFQYAVRVIWAPSPAAPGTRQSVTLDNLSTAQVYYFAIKTRDQAGNWSALSNVWAFAPGTEASTRAQLPLALDPPWPNPARGSVSFAYELPTEGPAALEVFDAAGRHVRTLASGPAAAGRTQLAWDLRDDRGIPALAGVYFLRGQLGGQVLTRRFTVLR